MSTFSIDDLKVIMRSAADEEPTTDLDGDIMDHGFAELGFDSLAVLEIVTRIQQDYHLPMPDEAVDGMKTPRDVVEYVSQRLQAVA